MRSDMGGALRKAARSLHDHHGPCGVLDSCDICLPKPKLDLLPCL